LRTEGSKFKTFGRLSNSLTAEKESFNSTQIARLKGAKVLVVSDIGEAERICGKERKYRNSMLSTLSFPVSENRCTSRISNWVRSGISCIGRKQAAGRFKGEAKNLLDPFC